MRLKKATSLEDSARVASLTDSIFLLYDQRMELYPATKKRTQQQVLHPGYKASDFYKFNRDDPTTANAWFKESIDCLKEQTSAAVLSQYYVTSFYAMKAMEGDSAKEKLGEMLTEYLVLTDYIESNIANAVVAEEPKLPLAFKRPRRILMKSSSPLHNVRTWFQS